MRYRKPIGIALFLVSLVTFGVWAYASGSAETVLRDVLKLGSASSDDKEIELQTNVTPKSKITADYTTGDFTLNQESLTVGSGAAAEQSFILDTGDGASNATVKVDGSRNFTIEDIISAVFKTDDITVGDGTAADQDLTFDAGNGAGNAQIRWSETNSVLEFSNDGSSFTAIGSGAGAGGIPVDGTGGAPSVVVSRTTAGGEFLRGAASLKMVKGASNLQGNGFSYDYTIDRADFSKRLTWSFEWMTSANYVSGDMGLYLYRVTATAKLIPVSYVDLPAHQTVSTPIQVYINHEEAGDYRVIWHVQTTNASAYNVFVDNVSVGPQDEVQASPQSDWESFTPTGSWSTNTTYAGFKKRIGDMMYASVKVTTSGAPDAATLVINIPDGLTINTAKIFNDVNNDTLGLANVEDSGTGVYSGAVSYVSSTTVGPGAFNDGGTFEDSTPITNTFPMTFANNDVVWFEFKVPIAEWSGASVGLTNSRVERAYNTSTHATADDTTSFANGPQGNLIGSITAELSRRVRFLTPIQSTDVISIEVSEDRVVWLPLPFRPSGSDNGIGLFSYNSSAARTYGIGYQQVSGSTTDVDIEFATSAWYKTANWSDDGQNAYYWRAVKSSNPISVGVPTSGGSMIRMVNDGSSGTGSTNTTVRRLPTEREKVGTAITCSADSATLGTFCTINVSAIYCIHYNNQADSGTSNGAISVNASGAELNDTTEYTTDTKWTNNAMRAVLAGTSGGQSGTASWCGPLNLNDVIRFHASSASTLSGAMATITQMSSY
jgi:hypothetical protein